MFDYHYENLESLSNQKQSRVQSNKSTVFKGRYMCLGWYIYLTTIMKIWKVYQNQLTALQLHAFESYNY